MPSEEKSHEDFLRLFLTHQRAILCYIRALAPAAQDADDILQETSITLWEKFGEFEAGSNFRAWAYKTAYWKVREARQKGVRSKLVFDNDLLDVLATDAENMSHGLDARHSALGFCLAKLKPGERRMLLVRYAEDGSVERAAETSGRSIQATYRALGRVKAALKECVKSQMQQPG